MDELNEQRQQRIKKLDHLRQAGVAPYGARFEVKDRAGQLLKLHGEKTKEVLEQEKIPCTIAGRVVALRRFGCQDQFGESGDPRELFDKHGLSAAKIAESLL